MTVLTQRQTILWICAVVFQANAGSLLLRNKQPIDSDADITVETEQDSDYGSSDCIEDDDEEEEEASAQPHERRLSGHRRRQYNNTKFLEKELLREEKLEDGGYFKARDVLPIYWIVYAFLWIVFVWLLRRRRTTEKIEKAQRTAAVAKVACELLDFRRPTAGEMPPEGYFHRSHCPPEASASFQAWYRPSRSVIYTTLIRTIPRGSLRVASIMACATGIMWLFMYIVTEKKWLTRAFVTFHGPGNWVGALDRPPVSTDNYLEVMVQSFAASSLMIKTMLAFLLLYFVRQRIRWYEVLKTKVWSVQRQVELVSFLGAAFLAGDDLTHQRARHDIYRWLSAAHFFNQRALSLHLEQYSLPDLVTAGLLSYGEAKTIRKALLPWLPQADDDEDDEDDAPQEPVEARRSNFSRACSPSNSAKQKSFDRSTTFKMAHQNPMSSPPPRSVRGDSTASGSLDAGRAPTTKSQPRSVIGEALDRSGKIGTAATGNAENSAWTRDLLLWWVEVRVRATVKEKLMDKEGLKKFLGGVWTTRDLMEDLLLESSRRQLMMWVIMMQLLVDIFVVLLPLSAVSSDIYQPHIWTLPLPMVRTFIVTFFYDAMLQITAILWDPFDVQADGLHLDPVLVATERATFWNFSLSCENQLPDSLRVALDDIAQKQEEESLTLSASLEFAKPSDLKDRKDKKDKHGDVDKGKRVSDFGGRAAASSSRPMTKKQSSFLQEAQAGESALHEVEMKDLDAS